MPRFLFFVSFFLILSLHHQNASPGKTFSNTFLNYDLFEEKKNSYRVT